MIHLLDNFFLDSDDLNFTLVEWDGTYDKKTGKNKQNVSYWYCATIPAAFNALMTVMVRRGISKADLDGIMHVKRIVEEQCERVLDCFANFDISAIK